MQVPNDEGVTVAILTSRIRAQGASVITTLPAEVARRLAIQPGQELEWIEDGMGGFRVVPHTAESAEALEAHAQIMAEYDSVFRALAK
jgi:antitoxin component of MazEF toxin-antitoxin module